MIIETVNEHSFTEAFEKIRPDNFSYEGQKALYEYLEDLSEDIGTPIELDVISICCDYSEYESFEELKATRMYKYRACSHDFEDVESLRDYTTVLEIENTGRLIIQNF